MHNHIDYPANYSAFETISAKNAAEKPELHQGRILERVVRCDRMGISEIARRLHVSRRTLYNWFETKELGLDIICKIGFIIGHDFARDFPEEFAKKTNLFSGEVMADLLEPGDKPKDPIYYWMDRYIKLLEKFNELLSHEQKNNGEITV
ncbi:helix-turn-helix domain-containing protein [Mucilaginibacter sp.]|uniref:TetR/AcrR family transcriptional regulator n=1 Tax=Mucilaginibacter sp. TaxID=1882438 RepID=UPI0026348DED|nr:helix-turn-helix domain-containing protein [Mucilaginibacter sp.]MDB5029393.1 hypothetical protein [Mucilaginibacter sp.]